MNTPSSPFFVLSEDPGRLWIRREAIIAIHQSKTGEVEVVLSTGHRQKVSQSFEEAVRLAENRDV